MRRVVFVLLVFSLCLTLVSCGGKGSAPQPGTPLSDFYDALMAAQPEGTSPVLFPEQDPDLIESFYPGLLDMELAQSAFYFPPIVTSACELVMVEVKDKKDVKAVREIFQARIDTAADNTLYPDSAEGWRSRARIQESGTFVAMVVLYDECVIPENIFTVE